MNKSNIMNSSDESSKFFSELLKKYSIKNTDMFNEVYGNAGEINLDLDVNSLSINEFVTKIGVSERVFFHAIFAFLLSRFTGCNNVIYNSFDWMEDDNTNGSLNKITNAMPIVADCSDEYIDKYLEKFNSLISEIALNFFALKEDLPEEDHFKSHILLGYESNLRSNKKYTINKQGYIKHSKNQNLLYDLEVKITQHNKGYTINVEHTDRYSGDLIEKFVSIFKDIVAQFLKSKKLSDISLVAEDDLNIQNCANKVFEMNNKIDIIQKFKENVAKSPDNICLIYKNISYTYKQVDKMTDHIAWWMNNSNIKQQDSVVILTHRSHWYIILILACLKSDITYIPIDSALPKQRIHSIISHSDAKCVFMSDKTLELVKNLPDTIILQNVDNIQFKDVEYNIVEHKDSSLACILFTSGSTNIPKGVCISRLAYDNEIVFFAYQFNYSSTDIYALYASIGYSPHLDSLCTLIVGGAIAVVPAEIRLDMTQLNKYFEKHNVSSTFLTSGLLYQFATSQNNKSLRIVFRGGEKAKDFNKKCNFAIQDQFGCTECGNIFQINNDDKDYINELGYSIANTEVFVLDCNLNKLPILAIGELCVGGFPATSHYLDKDDKTINKFIKNPYGDGYLFRTGDYACFLGNGRVYNLGRRDHLVKIRGNRVEIAEIEKTINELNYISDSHVLAVKNNNNSNVLVAYVVINYKFMDDDNDLKNSIADWLRKKLPFYMIPTYFTVIDNIPYNVNGKVDNKSLPPLKINEHDENYVPPLTTTQKNVCKAFENALNVDKVGINDDFVLLGGDSLAAISAVSSLNNTHIKVNDIFNNKTAKNLAEYIEKTEIKVSKIKAKEKFAPVLNGACHFLYASIGNKYIPYNEVYHVTFKNISVLDIKEAVEKVYSVHPGLRINIVEYNNWYYMDGRKDRSLNITIDELEQEPDSNFFSNLVRKIDVFDDELLRVKLFVYKDDVHIFVEINHVIIDGYSVYLLLGELCNYLNYKKLESEKLDIFDISAREQLYFESPNVDKDIEFYRNIYNNYEFTSFPMSANSAENIVGDYVMESSELDSKIVNDVCDKLSVSPHNLFLTALIITLSNYANKNKILINRIFSDRNLATDKNIVACLVPRRPVCCQIFKNDTFLDIENKINNFIKNELKHEQVYRFYKETGLCYKKINYCVIYNYMDFIDLKTKTRFSNLNYLSEVIDYNRINPYPYGVSVEIIKQHKQYIINFRYDNKQYDKDVLHCAMAELIKLIKSFL